MVKKEVLLGGPTFKKMFFELISAIVHEPIFFLFQRAGYPLLIISILILLIASAIILLLIFKNRRLKKALEESQKNWF